MNDDRGIFFDEWQACLYAHYIYVLRTGDTVTEPTLRQVLLDSGLSEDDVRVLQDRAQALGPLDPGAEPEIVTQRTAISPSADDDGEDLDEDSETLDEDDGQLSMF